MVSSVGKLQEASCCALIFFCAYLGPPRVPALPPWMDEFLVYKTGPPPGASGETRPAQACKALRASWPWEVWLLRLLQSPSHQRAASLAEQVCVPSSRSRTAPQGGPNA